jgi:PAS domain S-box-containing protein
VVLMPEHLGRRPLKPWQAYLLATVATALTLGVRLALDAPLGGQSTLVMFTVPIMVSAYAGGLYPGLLATGLSYLAASYYLLPPIHSLAVASSVERWQQFFVALAGVVISASNEALHRARLRAEVATRAYQQADTALQENEERYRALVEWSPEAMIVHSNEKVLFVNPAAIRMFGATSGGDLVGKRVLDLVHRDFHEIALSRLKSPIDNGGVTPMETRLIKLDGTIIEAETQGTSIVYDGAPAHLVSIRDITDRKRVEAALRESEGRYRTLFEHAPDGILIADRESYYLDANASMCRMLGYARDEFIGLHASDIVAPTEVPNIESALRTIEARSDYHREWQFRRRDGSTFPVDVIATTMPDGNLLGMVRDVTERKEAERKVQESENRFRETLEQRVVERTAQLEAANAGLRDSRAELNSLFESLPGSYVVLTPGLKIVAVSDAYLNSTLTTREGLVGRDLFDMFPENPNDLEADAIVHTRASMDRVLLNAAPDVMAIQKHDVRRSDGVFEERYWSPINSPVFGTDRQIKYIVHRVEDVTDFMRQKPQASGGAAELGVRVQQMEAEIFVNSQQLQTANHLLEAANKELESFSYSVSHDLRAPLRAINGFAGIVLEDFGPQLPEEGRKYLDRIRNGGEQMGRLIDDLLAFSRLSRESMSRRTVDTAQLVKAVLDDLNPQGDGRQIEIKVGELPPCYGDPALLKHVWANLLSNAFKYSRGRTPAVVEIGCCREDGQNTYFVRDNGAGFDMTYAHKLFGVFQRLHRTDEFEGTGVGLAIVQRVVQRHGGRVWGEAEEDCGAAFHFTVAEEGKT